MDPQTPLSQPPVPQPNPEPYSTPPSVIQPNSVDPNQQQTIDATAALATPVPIDQTDPYQLSTSDIERMKRRKRRLILSIIGAVCAVVLLTGLMLIVVKIRARVTYAKFNQFSFEAEDKVLDPRFTLSYPTEMRIITRGFNSVEYKHTDSNNQTFSSLAVAGEHIGKEFIPQVKEPLFAQLKEGKGSLYDQIIAAFEKSYDSGKAKNITLGQFSEFSGTNNKNGMIAEFQMQYENDKTKGKLLLTFGENHLFTVIVYADEAIWNENISVWQKILDEFKPDITQ